MHKRIEAIKSNEEIGVKYMQEWEEKIIEQRKAREEGLAEGLSQGRDEKLKEQVQVKLAKGKSTEEIADELEESVEKIKRIISLL